MHRLKRRTYVSATLDIFIQCRSNWVFKNRIWRIDIAVTHLLSHFHKHMSSNWKHYTPLSLHLLWCLCWSVVRVCVQDSVSVYHPLHHTLTAGQRASDCEKESKKKRKKERERSHDMREVSLLGQTLCFIHILYSTYTLMQNQYLFNSLGIL